MMRDSPPNDPAYPVHRFIPTGGTALQLLHQNVLSITRAETGRHAGPVETEVQNPIKGGRVALLS